VVTFRHVAGIAYNSFDLDRLRRQIRPLHLHWFPRLRSTNDHAAMLRRRGELFAPAMVLTGRQIAGRGRNTNTWWSGPGCLTVTFVLPIDEQLAAHQVPLLAGLAVRNAVVAISGESSILLKWPNDLIHRGRKLAGILCERLGRADLIGVGLNVNVAPDEPPGPLRARVTSLSQIVGRTLDKTDVLIALTNQIYSMLLRKREHPFAAALREYDQHHALLGRRISVSVSSDAPAITGTCKGLDSIGRLLVRTRGGQTHRIIAGQVQLGSTP